MSMFALLSTWWWRARVREEKGGRERRTLSPLSRRVTASACYNFLLSLHCHDARSFFFSFLYHQIRLMDHPIQYTRVSRGTWFHNFPILLAKGFFAKGTLQKSVELKTRIIRKDIFLLLSFFSLNVQQRFNSFYEFRRQGSDRTYVQFRLRFGRRNGRVHGRHVGAEVMRQLGHVIRAGHSLRYARHARHAGRAGTVGRYARDGGFRCRWRRHRGLRAAVRCQDHGLSYIRDRSKRSDGIFLLSSSIYHPLGTPLHWAEDRH